MKSLKAYIEVIIFRNNVLVLVEEAQQHTSRVYIVTFTPQYHFDNVVLVIHSIVNDMNRVGPAIKPP